MARCTAPVRGHRTASARADCPACGSRYGRSSYSSYGGSYSSPSYSSSGSSGGGWSSGGGSVSNARPRWSRAGSSVVYTPAEVRALTPVRESVEKRVSLPDLRGVFLCHAWDDRAGAAKELHDLLESRAFKGTMQDFWIQLSQDGESKTVVKELQFTMQLGVLTLNNPQFVLALRATYKPASRVAISRNRVS